MDADLTRVSVELPNGALELLQPTDSAGLPDDGGVEWAPVAPYSEVLWRSGVALARLVDRLALDGRRVVELGCGLGLPSIAAARAGAQVLGTDRDPEALALLARNATANGVELETAPINWEAPERLVRRGPFDLVLAADVVYERKGVDELLELLPRLAPEVLLVTPYREFACAFLEQAAGDWKISTRDREVLGVHRLRRRPQPTRTRAGEPLSV